MLLIILDLIECDAKLDTLITLPMVLSHFSLEEGFEVLHSMLEGGRCLRPAGSR
jgi:hypothetical protein